MQLWQTRACPQLRSVLYGLCKQCLLLYASEREDGKDVSHAMRYRFTAVVLVPSECKHVPALRADDPSVGGKRSGLEVGSAASVVNAAARIQRDCQTDLALVNMDRQETLLCAFAASIIAYQERVVNAQCAREGNDVWERGCNERRYLPLQSSVEKRKEMRH